MVRKHVTVRGQVQGVGFRWNARTEATRLGVSGYARNLPDGSVEAEVEGADEDVARMLEWLRVGPPHAEVDSVEVEDVPAIGETGFRIR